MIIVPFFFCLFSLLARRENSNPNITLDLSRNSKLLNKQEKNQKLGITLWVQRLHLKLKCRQTNVGTSAPWPE